VHTQAKGGGPPPTLTETVVGAGATAVNAVISTSKQVAAQLTPTSLWARAVQAIPRVSKLILLIAAVVQTVFSALCLYFAYLLMVTALPPSSSVGCLCLPSLARA
jgi:hypothetical protein